MYYRTILIILSVLLCGVATAQPDFEKLDDQHWDKYRPIASYMPFLDYKTRKYGFKDEEGTVINASLDLIEPLFIKWGQESSNHQCPIYLIKKGDLWGYTDLWGKHWIEPQFEKIGLKHFPKSLKHQADGSYYTDGDSAVFYFTGVKNQKMGLFDITGNELFPPKYGRARFISENLLIVKENQDLNLKDDGGVVDINNNVVVPLKYYNISTVQLWSDSVITNKHNQDKIYVTGIEIHCKDKTDNWYHFNIKGELIWTYMITARFENFGITIIKSKYGIINMETKETIVPAQYNSIIFGITDHPFATTKDYFAKAKAVGSIYYFDSKGELLRRIDPRDDLIDSIKKENNFFKKYKKEDFKKLTKTDLKNLYRALKQLPD
ncbi:MAG: WG repeat-containing protein [Flavobacteriales bacterium]|nr:WG repeat-containing protein [Flavobacteriales bacterium]